MAELVEAATEKGFDRLSQRNGQRLTTATAEGSTCCRVAPSMHGDPVGPDDRSGELRPGRVRWPWSAGDLELPDGADGERHVEGALTAFCFHRDGRHLPHPIRTPHGNRTRVPGTAWDSASASLAGRTRSRVAAGGVIRRRRAAARPQAPDGAANESFTRQFVAGRGSASARQPGAHPVAGATPHVAVSSTSIASGVNQSSRGPSATRSTSSSSPRRPDARSVSPSGPATSLPTTSSSPDASGAGPSPVVGSELRLPRTRRPSRPTRTAR